MHVYVWLCVNTPPYNTIYLVCIYIYTYEYIIYIWRGSNRAPRLRLYTCGIIFNCYCRCCLVFTLNHPFYSASSAHTPSVRPSWFLILMRYEYWFCGHRLWGWRIPKNKKIIAKSSVKQVKCQRIPGIRTITQQHKQFVKQNQKKQEQKETIKQKIKIKGSVYYR